MKTVVYQVDAFRAEPFLGNPAGVCVLQSPQPDAWMQATAREMNLSETAFLLPASEAREDARPPGTHGCFQLRWFTPKAEVKLCGHATLASAHILWEQSLLDIASAARFQTLSGLLLARKNEDKIVLDFPPKPASPAEAAPGLLEALGVGAQSIGRSEFDYLVEVESAEVLRKMRPNFVLLREITVRGIIVTARSDDKRFDFLSRYFAPAVGIDEDPVTGSAHCTLAPFWDSKLGKTRFIACQVSSRGGVLEVELRAERVHLAGKAVTTGKREFDLA